LRPRLKEQLDIDYLGGALLGIYNRNHNDRKTFFITAVTAGVNEVLICPSTLKRNRFSMGRA